MGAVVVDGGARYFRAGISQESKPNVMITSSIGVQGGDNAKKTVGSVSLAEYQNDLCIKDTIVRGKVCDWDNWEALMDFSCSAMFRGEKSCHRFLLSEGVESTQKERDRAAEIIFEKFNASGLFFINSAPLSLFACARNSGIVLDLGEDLSTCSVVTDGQLQRSSVCVSEVGGRQLNASLLEKVENSCSVIPKFEFSVKVSRDGTKKITAVDSPSHPSYRRFWQLEIIDDLKRTCSSCTYELPDGTIVADAGDKVKSTIDLLFDPSPLGRPNVNLSLPDLLFKSVGTLTSADRRRDLLSSVVLCGGTSCIESAVDTFASIVAVRAGKNSKSRVITPGPLERDNACWIGGSILGSISAFGEIMVSKAEFKEDGISIIAKKCP